MAQLVADDEQENKFFEIYKRLLNQTFADQRLYYDNAYNSPELGACLFDVEVMPIYKMLERSLFIRAFSEILEGEKITGTYNGILKILYAIFGQSAEIVITKINPAHIKIDIHAPLQVFYLWFTKDKRQIITKDNKAIVFGQILARVTSRQLLQILQSVGASGTYIEFTLNREEI